MKIRNIPEGINLLLKTDETDDLLRKWSKKSAFGNKMVYSKGTISKLPKPKSTTNVMASCEWIL